MSTVKDLINAAPALRPIVEAMSPAIQEFDVLTTEIVEAVVEVAVAVSVAMVTGRWDQFFEKFQEVFSALSRLRTLSMRAEMFQLPNDATPTERQLFNKLQERIELAKIEAAAMKKLLLTEAKSRQEDLTGVSTRFDGVPGAAKR